MFLIKNAQEQLGYVLNVLFNSHWKKIKFHKLNLNRVFILFI
jgi:hypothetical protein